MFADRNALPRATATLRDVLLEMQDIDRADTKAGKDFLENPRYQALRDRAEDLALQREKLLDVKGTCNG